MTKVLAINGSASMEKGNTAKILAAYLEGMEEAGASTEIVYAKRLKIRPCTGDFQCWFEKVGECIHSDDMQEVLFPKMREADILVLAIPVYLPLPGEMQNLLNRLMPICEQILEFRDGRTRAKFHHDVNISKIVLVSVGGWWEKDNLSTVVRIAEEIADNTSIEFVGSVLRPHAFWMAKEEEKAKQVLDATRQAGFQLIKEGKMPSELLAIISQPLVSEEELRQYYNAAYERARLG
ncbi:MAG: flavodoxin family protein [Candidatus Thorarchaeota archaeon]|jgi:multimeric flavodoxin WrbA